MLHVDSDSGEESSEPQSGDSNDSEKSSYESKVVNLKVTFYRTTAFSSYRYRNNCFIMLLYRTNQLPAKNRKSNRFRLATKITATIVVATRVRKNRVVKKAKMKNLKSPSMLNNPKRKKS